MEPIEQMAPWFGDEEKEAVVRYMESGAWLTEFRETKNLESMIADYVGAEHCVLLCNGTVTLFAALLALDIGDGDEVIVPDLTMVATANAVVLTGARPVLVDIDSSTLCLDLDQLEDAVTERTRAVMLVSLNGRAPDMERAGELSRRHGIELIEDAAQSLGSRHQDRMLGTFGRIGSYSFSTPKIISTGQGGALVTDDAGLADRFRKIKNFGRRRGGIDEYEALGYNFKFTDLQAVIGIEQMKKLDWRVDRKREIFRLYREELDIDAVEIVPTDLSQTTPWFIDVLVPEPQALAEHLRASGIGTRPFYPPLHEQLHLPKSSRSFPITTSVSARGLWLPSSSSLTDEAVCRVCGAIRDFYASR